MKSAEAAGSSKIPFVGGLFALFTADAVYHGDQVHQVRSHHLFDDRLGLLLMHFVVL